MDLAYMVIDILTTIFYWMLWCTGAVLNVVLLVVFIRHSETRTPENVLLINLCVADLIYLLRALLYLLDLFLEFDQVAAYSITFSDSFSIALTIITIVAISIQRYFGISKFRNRSDVGDKSYTKSLLILIAVWILAAGFATLEIYVILRYCEHTCESYMIMGGNNAYRLLMYGFIPCIVIMGFYTATSCLIQRGARRIPGVETEAIAELRKRRKKTASVITGLSISFNLTYLPLFICVYVATTYQSGYNMSSVLHYALASVLSVLNPVTNPAALYRTSTQLKGLMRSYICYCCDRARASRSSEDAPKSNDAAEISNLHKTVEVQRNERAMPAFSLELL